MRLIILGAPGAGKGTQAKILSDKYQVPHISTGEIFRSNIKEGTSLGMKAKEYIDDGKLVPDSLTIEIVKEYITREECKSGFVLDGFPRTIPQAEYLDKALVQMNIKLSAVLNIFVEDEEIVKRLSGRRVCPKCGSSYHISYNPPEPGDVCKNCKTKVIQREDDTEETILERIRIYYNQTVPLIDYYKEKGLLITATGQEEISDTTKEVFEVLKNIK